MIIYLCIKKSMDLFHVAAWGDKGLIQMTSKAMDKKYEQRLRIMVLVDCGGVDERC
jgi:hypothetical protein